MAREAMICCDPNKISKALVVFSLFPPGYEIHMKMGSFNSKAAVRQNPFYLSKTNKDPKMTKEDSLPVNSLENRDQNGVRTEDNEMGKESVTKEPQNQATSDVKRPSNLPQYMWLMSCPMERDEAKRVSEFTKCVHPGPSLQKLRNRRNDDTTSHVHLISSHTKAENCTKRSSSNKRSPENRARSTHSETGIGRNKGFSDHSNCSVMSHRTSLDVSRSVGFGVLMSDSHLNRTVTGHGVAAQDSIQMP